ncbi:MAG: helix-turn-helix domain-containing protein [Candidatus Doudnabacteria bacterium]|nr:helix-turn-helix domain-containing protein [Candidatus Doudnabacteria bacterium]
MKINKQDKKFYPTPSAGPNGTSGEFLSMHQASKMTGYHQDYLGQMARSGKLGAQKVGRNWYTSKLAIDRMLGRAPQEEVAAPLVQESNHVIEQPVVEQAAQIVLEKITETIPVHTEVVKAEIVNVIKEEKVVLENSEIRVITEERKNNAPVPVMVRRAPSVVKVKRLEISIDAGPNLHESLSVPEQEKNVAINIIGNENKNYYLRWQRIIGPEQKQKMEIARIKGDLAVLTKRFEQSKLQDNKARLQEPKANRNIFKWYLTASTAAVCLAIIGTAYLVTGYFASSVESMSAIDLQEKRVAGEATNIFAPEEPSEEMPQVEQEKVEVLPVKK